MSAIFVSLSSCTTLPPDASQFQYAHLLGVVYDGASRSVQGFEVFIDDRPAVFTDINGKFTLSDISKGDHSIVAKKQGYQTIRLSVNFTSRTQILYITSYSTRDYLSTAETALKQSDYLRAQDSVAKALVLDPKDAVARYMMASIRVLVRDYAGAMPILRTLVQDNIREIPIYLLMIDIGSLDSKNKDEVLALIEADPLFRHSPQIDAAMRRMQAQQEGQK